MRQLRAALLRIRALFGTSRQDRELADELATHLELHIADNVRNGMTPDEARRQAVIHLGGIEATKERYRDRRGIPALENLVRDARFGLRMFRKHPGFSAIAVLTLALGIGVTTAIFTVINWTLLRPVPGIRAPEEVFVVWTGIKNPGGVRVSRISYPNYFDLRSHLTTITLAGYQTAGLAVAGGEQSARRVLGKFVTASFFDVLGVSMRAGRPFTNAEDNPSNPVLVAVLSDRLWASMFDRSPAAIGQTIRVNGHEVTVVGIASAAFRGLQRTNDDALWLPGASYPIVNRLVGLYDNRSSGGFYEFIARFGPGMGRAQVDAELQSLAPWLLEQYPTENSKFNTTQFLLMNPVGIPPLGGNARLATLLGLMMGAGALILLICCANVASLLMIRGISRQSEVAVRKALGASRSRLLGQQLTEGLLLWIFGGATGLALVWILAQAVEGSPISWLGIGEASVPLDWRVMTFTAALSLAVGLLFSILPALRTVRADAIETVRAAGLTATVPRFRSGAALTVAQLAASLTLLVGALLLVSTVRHLARVDIGFEPDGLTSVRLDPGSLGYKEADAWTYFQTFTERLSAVPGVASVAISTDLPFSSSTTTRLRRVGDTADVDGVVVAVLSANYFDTVGIRLLRGRSFTSEEIGGPGRPSQPAVILGESFARRLFGTIDVVGEPIMILNRVRGEVIGIAADVRTGSLTEKPALLSYDPRGLLSYDPRGLSRTPTTANLLVRASNSVNVAEVSRAIAAGLNAALPVQDPIPMTDYVAAARSEWDVLARLLGLLASAAALLSAIGVYGVTAFAVASRRREFGIRLALGATTAQIRQHVVGRTVPLTLVSLVCGLAGAVGLAEVLKSRLVGVEPFDPLLWTLAAATLVATVLVASFLPARQATRVSVAETLRAL